jgi:hypothetical protein
MFSKEKRRNNMADILKKITMGLGSIILAALLLALTAPKTVHAVVSALVTVANTAANPVPTQQAIPAKPFFGRMVLSSGSAQSAGPGTGETLAVSNITLTNFSNSTQQVFVFNPVFSTGGTCGDPVIGGGEPSMYVDVPALQTVTLPFPSSVVFTPINSSSCIAAEDLSGSPVEIYVTGFAQ